MSSTRLSGDSLESNLLISVFTLDSVVSLNTLEELSSALGRNDMINLDVNSLLNNAVSDLLVDFNTDSSLGDVEDNTSAAMETLEGHTLVDGTVGLNIDVVTILVTTQVSRERNDTMFTEVSLEHVTSTSTITVSVRHLLERKLESEKDYTHKFTKTNGLLNSKYTFVIITHNKQKQNLQLKKKQACQLARVRVCSLKLEILLDILTIFYTHKPV